MIVRPLAEYPEVLPTLADWYLSEWAPYYGAGGPGDARADLEARCHRDRLPIGLVAVEGDRVYGTVALDRDATTGLSPSVVALLVAPGHRGRGIATRLIESAEDLARELGYRRLYVSSSVLGGLFRRRGWREMGRVRFLNAERGAVYARDL